MRTTTTLMLFGLCFVIQAQSPYRPFPESGAGWIETHAWLQPLSSQYEWHSCERRFLFGTDTVLSGVSYRRLRHKGMCSVQPIPPTSNPADYYSYNEEWSDAVYFRQDVAERKLFAWDPGENAEALWYDFTLPIGGYPFMFNAHVGPDALHVVALDSMELNDGWHRTWVLDYDLNNGYDSAFCTVIEGVGSTFGLLAELTPTFENEEMLNCHAAHAEVIYPLGGEVCDLTVSTTQVLLESNRPWLAYPNPTSGPVTITGELPLAASYMVMDAFGRIVGHGRLVDQHIDLSGSAPAPYLIRIQEGNGRSLATLRVVKVD